MSLRVVGDVNKLAKATLDRIPEFKTNEEKVFEILVFEQDPTSKEKLFGANRSYVCHDNIIDTEGNMVEIGIPQVFNKDGVKRYKKFDLGAGSDKGVVGGRFTLFGNKPEDREFFAFFSLWNANASNPNREQSVRAEIRMLDPVADMKTRTAKRSELREALKLCENMMDAEVRMTAALLNKPFEAEISVVRDAVETYATEFPAEFLKRYEDPNKQNIALIKEALAKSVIRYEKDSHIIVWGASGDVIATLPRLDGKDEAECFAAWVASKDNGMAVLGGITDVYGKTYGVSKVVEAPKAAPKKPEQKEDFKKSASSNFKSKLAGRPEDDGL